MDAIACSVCFSEFVPFDGPAPASADGCASVGDFTAHGEYVVRCRYGSRHDTCEFRAPIEPQGWPKCRADPICDRCVDFAAGARQLRRSVD